MTILTPTLVARTVPIDPETAGLAALAGSDGFLLEHEGHGLAGRGVAARIELPGGLADPEAAERVSAALAAIASEDEVGRPGCGPVALGALPFGADRPGSLVVPAVIVGRAADGTAWRTTIARPHTPAGPPAPPDAAEPKGSPGEAATAATFPDAFRLTPSLPHDEWCRLVGRAVSDIRAGGLDKVVLAREVLVEANRAIDVASVLERLRSLYPSCLVFSVEGFVGATPELLVGRTGRAVRSHPLAGTIPRSGDPDSDDAAAAALLASAKELSEHRFAVDDVAGALRPLCTSLEVPDGPTVLALRNVSHLGTPIAGVLADPAPSALELAARLHPTAAVGGTPRRPALAWLAANEGIDRGPYGGPVGWVDARGDGEWRVGIRCALIDGHRARLLAGVGLVADSDPLAELAETQLKLQAMLAAVVRP